MAVTLKLDSDNDLAIENGNFVLLSGVNAIDQNIVTRLQTFLGEWFRDINVGVPWVQLIFKVPYNNLIASSILKAKIVGTKGVLKIDKIETSEDLVEKRGSMSYTATTEKNAIIENNQGVRL